MERYDLYQDIALRTQGDIYIGVVGPVRTGKSTFIKKFMDLLVLPNIDNPYNRERVIDELPQSGSGRMIMTTQPKFVPNEAVKIDLADEATLSVRMVDCVGYMVRGATGLSDNDTPRMVRTPWYDYDIPFQDAAELGTKKVITDHSTIGVVVTTDGSIMDIGRSNYIDAEERVVRELKELNKPFVIVLNSVTPGSEDTKRLRDAMTSKYDVPVLLMDIMGMTQNDIQKILEQVLFEFPIKMVNLDMPQWVQALDEDHWLIKSILDELKGSLDNMSHMRDHRALQSCFADNENIGSPEVESIMLGTGQINYAIPMDTRLFYNVLGEQCGCEIQGDAHLFSTMKELVKAKKEYDKVAGALASVKVNGYGMVPPSLDDIALEEPEIVKQGSRFGIRLKASAPSMMLMSVDVKTEVSPIMGSEKESQDLMDYLLSEFESDPAKLWNTNLFGKSLNDLVKDGLANKLHKIPDEAQSKVKEMMERMINEGNGGMVCILL